MKTTPWFPGDVKPVRVGVYHRAGRVRGQYLFSYWNGDYWCCLAVDAGRAAALGRSRISSTFQRIKWRGLTEPTEKK